MSFELDKFIVSGKEIEVVDNTAREAIEGLQGNIEVLQPKADSSLNTTSKTVVGGINELNSDLSNKQNISSALKCEVVPFNAGNINANGDLIINVSGLTNNGIDVAYIVDFPFDCIFGTARRVDSTTARVSMHNFYSQAQNVNYGTVIRLYK